MPYQIADQTGAIRTLNDQDRIDGIDKETLAQKLYVVDVAPFGHSQIGAALISPVEVVISPFASLSGAGVPSYGASYTAKGDIHWKIVKMLDPESGAEVLKSIGHVNFKAAPNSGKRKLIRVEFLDKRKGFSFSGQYTCTFNLVTYPNKDWQGNLGEPVTTTIPITPSLVEMTTGFITSDGVKLIDGSAMLEVPRDQITYADALASEYSYFTIRLGTGPVVKYYLWHSEKGVCVEKTHHFNFYMTKGLA